MSKSVSYQTEDRQWDIRINIPTDEYFQSVVENIMMQQADGRFRYILVGGVEIGTQPTHSDYQVKHVHIAVIYSNRCSKASILKRWGILEGHGYYMVPRNRDLSYTGWREHHTKLHSKVDANSLVTLEYGTLPNDIAKDKVVRSDIEKKRKVDEILIEMRQMLKDGKDEEAFVKFPRNFLTYGAKLKATIHQKANFFGDHTNPHIWLFGFPGTGKTSIMKFLYPNLYKKDLQNRFFDLYDQKMHTHIMLEDLDHENVEKLGIQFLKTLCDENGFPIDQKYQTPQITRSTILVTSNYDIVNIMPHDARGVETTVTALLRRFWHVRIDNFLRMLGLKLVDKWDRQKLKKEGNEDPAKLYISWDYVTDTPTGLPLKRVEEYQELVRTKYYEQ